MGEFSEYFEDFPEKNPANWIGERFDPAGAKSARDADARAREDGARRMKEVRAHRAKIYAMIEEAKARTAPTHLPSDESADS